MRPSHWKALVPGLLRFAEEFMRHFNADSRRCASLPQMAADGRRSGWRFSESLALCLSAPSVVFARQTTHNTRDSE